MSRAVGLGETVAIWRSVKQALGSVRITFAELAIPGPQVPVCGAGDQRTAATAPGGAAQGLRAPGTGRALHRASALGGGHGAGPGTHGFVGFKIAGSALPK